MIRDFENNLNETNVKTELDMQLAWEEAEERKLEFKIVVYTKNNIIPTAEHYRKDIIDKIVIKSFGESNKKVIIHNEVLHNKHAKEDLKKLLEHNKFHTFGGFYDVAALLTEDIYLNIYRDWCPDYKNPLRVGLDVDDIEFAMNSGKFVCLESDLAFERGKAFYFGLGIDKNILLNVIEIYNKNIAERKENIIKILEDNNIDIKIKDDEHIMNVIRKVIQDGDSLKTLNMITHDDTREEYIRALANEGYWFKKYSNELAGFKTILNKMRKESISLINTNYNLYKPLFMYGSLTENTVLKLREGYSLIETSLPAQLQLRLANMLGNKLEDVEDYYMYMASKAFNKDLEETTMKDRKDFKVLFFVYTADLKDDEAFRESYFMYYNDEEYYEMKEKVFSYLNSLSEEIKQDISNLPEELQEFLKSIGNITEIFKIKNINKIERMIENYMVLQIQKHFGKYNFRVRYLGEMHQRIIYEVGNGEVEEFKNYLNELELKIGKGAVKLEADRIRR